MGGKERGEVEGEGRKRERGSGPSAEELEWMAKMRMHFETVWLRSARMRKGLRDMVVGCCSLEQWEGCLEVLVGSYRERRELSIEAGDEALPW